MKKQLPLSAVGRSQPLVNDYRPEIDSMGVVNGRLVIEFKHDPAHVFDIPAGTLVCEPYTDDNMSGDGEDYPYYSTTLFGTLWHTEGVFTPR